MSVPARKRVVALGGVGIGVEVVYHMELPDEATRLEAAVARVYREGEELTPDQARSGTTKGFCAAALAALRNG